MTKKKITPKTIKVGDELIKKLKLAIRAELSYEKATQGERKFGITGEAGELLACHHLGLRLVLDSLAKGYDALDKKGLKVQIKTRRSNSEELPSVVSLTSRFSEHRFDYALLVLLDHKYRPREIWQASYRRLKPFIENHTRRCVRLAAFKRVGEKVFDG